MSIKQAISPSLEEFKRIVREEFAFMFYFNFQEIPPLNHSYQNPFEIHYEKEEWRVVVEGLSYGFSAGIRIDSPAGKSAGFGHLVSKSFWDAHRQKFARGQQGDIGFWALAFREFGQPFLKGEWSAFHDLLQKQEIQQAANLASFVQDQENRKMQQAIQQADTAFKNARYADVITELAPFEKSLPLSQITKLTISRKRNAHSD